ncbi:DNA polymerase Y family protein [Shewanella sp. C32]|uniref:DNA polymerase Y family protein n=1 Tax=Shewanella electrica TaxID=515560 RepID=A0ABT2FP93_9GAMM|nr:DNA polymerase Y family protein [Shewanella electrica]MCH1923811.1 DNA polymerase Y family protein [Shewanella electrica]MCS4557029.1 DNA polymerase Y family protein [Shewanella electrica]
MAECWLAAYFPGLLLQFHAWSLSAGHVNGGDVFTGLPPQALFDQTSRQIVAASPAAQAEGVTIGLSTTTAQALLPALQLTDHTQVDRARLTQWLCQWHYDFSARIFPALVDEVKEGKQSNVAQQSLQLAIWPQETLLLEVGSMLRLFGGVDKLLERYQQRLSHYGLLAHWALAKQPLHAAILAAQHQHHAPALTRQHRVSTPRQTRFSTPTISSVAATVTCPELIASELPDHLPISQLPLAAPTRHRLQQMGIHRWQQLRQLPRAELGKRFGQSLLTLLLQLEGRLSCQRPAYQLPLTFSLAVLLPHDVEFIQGLTFPLAPMLTQLADYLRGRQLAVRQLQLTLRYRERDQAPLSLSIDYPLGEYRADGLLQLCRLQLARLTLASPVTEITLLAEHFVEPEIPNTCLADDSHTRQPLTQLLAKLQARLGAEQVRSLAASAHPLPEQASASHTITQWPPPAQPQPAALALRPLWLLNEPELIAADEVTLLRGPERISYCWSTSLYPLRDYYVALHQSGRYCWVFRSQQQLLLHGWMS